MKTVEAIHQSEAFLLQAYNNLINTKAIMEGDANCPRPTYRKIENECAMIKSLLCGYFGYGVVGKDGIEKYKEPNFLLVAAIADRYISSFGT